MLLGRWVTPIVERRGLNKAVVALANKLARMAWTVVANNTPYDVRRALANA